MDSDEITVYLVETVHRRTGNKSRKLYLKKDNATKLVDAEERRRKLYPDSSMWWSDVKVYEITGILKEV